MRFSYLKRFRQGADFAAAVRISVLFLVAALAGCGGGAGSTTSPEAEHIGKVSALIGDFKAANSGNNPKNIDDLKNWAIKNGKGEDKDFISTRDKEPYVIAPMAAGGMPEMGAMASKMPIILHEATGKGGKKFAVIGSGTKGSEMSEDAIKGLIKGRPNVSAK